ncbi:hypothetical protein GCM10008955_10650 [Deinococcus malanensis]|uniref:MYXO-CTERM domain-containing protein n=2 Tax=Deinococcus malanensis TaxID=1706855 RepID=A0ABQ2EPB7_9DEIO|nr:hypothetical protein [Deinococcus malanensis]GGK19086.1 hypothetical protein GCM10008955_10650 [Deinococcus malanensis]
MTTIKKLTLALSLIVLPLSATAQTDATPLTENDTVTTPAESDTIPGNEGGELTDPDAIENDAVTTAAEDDGIAGNEVDTPVDGAIVESVDRDDADFPWGLLGLLGLTRLAGRRRRHEVKTAVKLGGPTDGPRQ